MNKHKNIAAIYAQKPSSYKVLKRGFDVVFSAAALVVVLPVMLASALAIMLEDGRPVFYLAPRQGKDGKPFTMYKLRTMVRGAEEMQGILDNQQGYSAAVGSTTLPHTNAQDRSLLPHVGTPHSAAAQDTSPAFKMKNDPRTTRVGRILRKYFIDELPQLVNVIRGDMSLVGPRAIQQTRNYTPYEAQRLVVQPGLTCYWQTSGNMRMPWQDWVELDLDYIEDMSLAVDARILAKTVGVVLRGEGEY